MSVKAYGAHAADKPLEPMDIERRDPGDHDVQIDIAYCGVCHSDLHTVRSEWGGTQISLRAGPRNRRPRHRGRRRRRPASRSATPSASAAWSAAASIAHACDEGLEQYCENGFVGTYNGPTPDAAGPHAGRLLAATIVVDEKFVLQIRHPEEQLAAVAPLLCAGITTYSPLRHWNAGPGQEGRHRRHRRARPHGHQARPRDGRAHGRVHHQREASARTRCDLGADEVVVSTQCRTRWQQHAGSFDFILDTVAASHDLDAFTDAAQARRDACAWSACPSDPHPSPNVGQLIFGRRSIAGSLIGGIAETQEMLDFCAEHGIVSDIEMIPIQKIDEAYDRMLQQRREVSLRDRQRLAWDVTRRKTTSPDLPHRSNSASFLSCSCAQ